jgi:nucleoside-triphosphatase THEP1/energy-coupling factor transporter transmembrane protein EcfT
MRARAAAALSVIAVFGVFLGPVSVQACAFGAALGAAWLSDRRCVRTTLRIGLLLAALFSSAAAAAVVAWSSTWDRALAQGGSMFFRLLVLVTLANLLARATDSEKLFELTRRIGLRRLGLVLGLALNAFPQLLDSTRQVTIAWRVRRRSRTGPKPSALTLAEVLLAHVARIADDAAAAAALRGHDALFDRPRLPSSAAPVIVATGKPGTGKTTILLDVLAGLAGAPDRVVGIAQPGLFEHGRKVGFRIRDLDSGETTEFAQLVDRAEGQHGTRFQFLQRGLDLAARALGKASPGDLLVIDELGPMELRGIGHMPAVRAAMSTPGLRATVIVVRTHLVPSLLAALDARDASVVDLTGIRGAETFRLTLERVLAAGPSGNEGISPGRRGRDPAERRPTSSSS